MVGPFDETLPALEDWDFLLRVVMVRPLDVFHVAHVLGEYSYFLSNVARTLTNQMFSDDAVLQMFGIWHWNETQRKIQMKAEKLVEVDSR